MKSFNRNPRGEQGAVAVEFALVFTILAMLLFGIVEFGIFFSRYQVYQGAAREGARLAATRASEAAIQARVQEAAAPYNSDDSEYRVTGPVTVVVEDGNGEDTPCDSTTRGKEVKVSWTQQFKDAIVLPFVPDVSLPAGVSGVFRCE